MLTGDDDGWAEHYATEAGHRMWPSEELVRWISGRRFEKALDVGCGTGSNVRLLVEHANHIVAVEPNPVARDVMQEMWLLRRPGQAEFAVDVIGAEACAMPVGDGEFDLVVDVQVSQHISEKEHVAIYRQYYRVLTPGGWLFLLHMDDRTSVAPGERANARTGFYDWDHVALFPSLHLFCLPPRDGLMRMVSLAGLKIDEVRGLVREYPDGQAVSYTIITATKLA